ncbi:hypothetical protein GQ43DRAFT_416872 [Delitschia confertaspora ATCC 74209]|uniref:Transcription initiation factor TFIID subunit 1 histone acetyltransferase domain-containing protein n=1 Tax=Delitschia confertaspora ATCC 74209 TaxID=1513339 RepID=A0A9P4JKU8_9PLEO|nr:hypothetical protein GQ43DRAFT_416872 [Delitschia confertaspora ATCC 74209]
MPHATSQDDQQEIDDENTILRLLQDDGTGDNLEFLNRELEVGEKADDAVDYGDIDDDDLAEDEEGATGQDTLNLSGTTVPNMESFEDDVDLDDLFGDGVPSSPVEEQTQHDFTTSGETLGVSEPHPTGVDKMDTSQDEQTDIQPTVEHQDEEEEDAEYLEQKALFEQSRKAREEGERRGSGGAEVFAPPANAKEILERRYPDFEPEKPPRFIRLFPAQRARYIPKAPLKPPKPLQAHKVNLELAVDQERSFLLPEIPAFAKPSGEYEADARGIVHIEQKVEEQGSSDVEMEADDFGYVDDDQEMIGNVSSSDLKLACVDWEIPSLETLSDEDEAEPAIDTSNSNWIRDLAGPATKKRRLTSANQSMAYPTFNLPLSVDFDDPEAATAKISKKIILDMNDPFLLLDVQPASTEPQKPRAIGMELKRDARGSLANPMFKRYNISNDEAYDALKENHQHKVRSTLGHMAIEHSLPALKLQYPFYQVTLSDRELRSFHRPTFTCKSGERVTLSPLKYIKRKTLKGLKPQEIYKIAEDLSAGDNSDILLAEYSEEYPTTLSNFGMGNKILNYYRRKDPEDTSRPKMDLGETAVLLPQDKSPFSVFGDVEPGQTVPALHNAMYRAPIFKHEPKSTDFLVSRSHTGVNGSKWYMRNIQNLIVVGQEFPSVEVPGTHARKVTEASKKRLKMLSFRLWRKGQQKNAKQPWVSNEMIRHHLPGTEIAQNRSRMREIMTYDKDKGTWNPKDGEVVPDEETLRTWIKPEDICLIDSMHAGDRHLMDAGFNKDQISKDEDDDDGAKVELKLAPWHTTKNFLNACQGKAMLELHGEGDPTGRGEAFSFIKVSMKGGFRDVGESIGEKLDAKKLKELGGHSYNVARQQQQYEMAIKRIWNKQADSLSAATELSDIEMDVEGVDAEQNATRGRTPRSEFGTPAAFKGDDETASQYSKFSNTASRQKVLRIKRWMRNEDTGEMEQRVEIIRDRKIAKEYVRRQREERIKNLTIEDLKPTGNAEFDAQQQLKLKKELARLTRNVERREGREKSKHLLNGSNPGTPTAGGGKGAGSTPRKCANCGEVGHIKTNKKLCPLLNGQKRQSDIFRDAPAASPASVFPPSQPGSFATSPQ